MPGAINDPIPHKRVTSENHFKEPSETEVPLNKGLLAKTSFAQLLIAQYPAFSGKKVEDVITMIENYPHLLLAGHAATEAATDALVQFNNLGGQSALDAWNSVLSVTPDIGELLMIDWTEIT